MVHTYTNSISKYANCQLECLYIEVSYTWVIVQKRLVNFSIDIFKFHIYESCYRRAWFDWFCIWVIGQQKWMHYILVNPCILQMLKIPTTNTLAKNGQKMGKNCPKLKKGKLDNSGSYWVPSINILFYMFENKMTIQYDKKYDDNQMFFQILVFSFVVLFNFLEGLGMGVVECRKNGPTSHY